MSDLRKAAQQALEALEKNIHYTQTHLQDFDAAYNRHPSTENERGVITDDIEDAFAAMSALRAALAEPEQEPVAWMNPQWIDPDTRGWPSDNFASQPIEGWLPLYTAPTPRKPLTNAEIDDLWLSPPEEVRNVRFRHTKFARAIEFAHGIGEQT